MVWRYVRGDPFVLEVECYLPILLKADERRGALLKPLPQIRPYSTPRSAMPADVRSMVANMKQKQP